MLGFVPVYRFRCFLLLVLFAMLAACQQVYPTTPALPSPIKTLVLYKSLTPTQTKPYTELQGFAASLSDTPVPSATPFTHIIAKGDTMSGIALKYGVSLADLLAANPDIDPHFMTIGKAVVIPIKVDGENPAALPTLTPVPVEEETPRCYVTATGGVWCFVLVKNGQGQPLENLSAWVGLFSSSGRLIDSQVALTPLNLIPPGASLPLVAYFSGPIPQEYRVQAQLLTALPVAHPETRYLPAQVEILDQAISTDRRQANITGNVMQPAGSAPAGIIWLAVVTYGTDGSVVGVRKWEADKPCPGYQPPGTPAIIQTPLATSASSDAAEPIQASMRVCMPFEISVFSLGPPIERFEVLIEARP